MGLGSRGGGGGHLGLNGQPLPNNRPERKRGTAKFRGGQLFLKQKKKGDGGHLKEVRA